MTYLVVRHARACSAVRSPPLVEDVGGRGGRLSPQADLSYEPPSPRDARPAHLGPSPSVHRPTRLTRPLWLERDRKRVPLGRRASPLARRGLDALRCDSLPGGGLQVGRPWLCAEEQHDMLVWDRVWVRRRLTVTCTLSCFVVREYLWLTHARALVARPSLCIFHILRLSEYWKAVFGWRGRQVRTVWTTGADNRSPCTSAEEQPNVTGAPTPPHPFVPEAAGLMPRPS